MKQTFRKELLSGKTLIGTVVTLPSPQLAEILAHVGFDWLWIDSEHSPLEMGEVQGILQAAGDRCAGVVRVPASDEVYIKKAFDIGAAVAGR
jgi:2-dehydro-3-deoxyglucarate aldolase/4-hydroxy-2-oxoheptanedioate aldolase